jgi:hypothetical protein
MSIYFPHFFANGSTSRQVYEFSKHEDMEFFDVSRSSLLHRLAHIPSPLSVAPDAPK